MVKERASYLAGEIRDLVRKYFRERVRLLQRNSNRGLSIQAEALQGNLQVEEAILHGDQMAEHIVRVAVKDRRVARRVTKA